MKFDIKENDVQEIEMGEFYEGDYFHKNASLNKNYEVAEKASLLIQYPPACVAMTVIISFFG